MRTWVLFGLTALLGACGGDDEPKKPEIVERTLAQAECDAVMNAWCESSFDCAATSDDPGAFASDEERAAQIGLCVDVAKGTCDATIDFDLERYDACLASVEMLEATDCEAVRAAVGEETEAPMPVACSALFVTD